MKFLLLFTFICATSASAAPWEEKFDVILSAQGKALDSFVAKEDQKSLPNRFVLKELITDFGVTKQGLFGISAVKSNRSVEVKWKKVKTLPEKVEDQESKFVVEESTSLDEISSSVTKLALASGKVKAHPQLEASIKKSLTQVSDQLESIELTSYNGWKLDGLRLDLNFGAEGQLSFLNFAGAKFRVRLEWKLKEKKLQNKMVRFNEQTAFVSKVLYELGSVADKIRIPGFTNTRILIGTGMNNKRSFGLWKYSAGFVGGLVFVPRPKDKAIEPSLPASVINQNFTMGGVEDEENKGLFRRVSFTRVAFSKGIMQSLETAARFAEKASQRKATHWMVAEIKTASDISKTGIFGLSTVSANGVIEMDYKRNGL